jgi:hypothetical protein
VSTARGGEHRGGQQPPGEPGSFEPGLDHLIKALTANGHPHERVGRDAALAAFRAAGQPPRRRGLIPARHRSAGNRRAAEPGRSPRLLLPARLAAVAAAGFAVIVGVTAAAYAQALPAPVQQIAYSVFAPLGVPNSKPHSGTANAPSPGSGLPSVAVTVSGSPSSAGAACPCPGQAAHTPSPSGTTRYVITATAASAQVPAGTRDLFTGKVSDRGNTASGVKIRLLERTAGSQRWRLAASGVTGGRGEVRLWSPSLKTSTIFRLAGPAGARSAPIAVTVAPIVRLRLVPGPIKDRLIVAAPGARPGDTVNLTEQVSGTWETVATKPLGPGLRAVFVRPAVSAAGHLYRADLLGSTAATSTSSKLVWIPRLPVTGAKVIQPSPSQSPTPGQTQTSAPTPPSTTPNPPGTTPTPQPTSSSTGATSTPSPTSSASTVQTPDPTTEPSRARCGVRQYRLASAPSTRSCAKRPVRARNR